MLTPRIITVDTNAADPMAGKERKGAGDRATSCELRQSTDLTTRVEHDHRFLHRGVKPGRGFFSLETAGQNLAGRGRKKQDKERTEVRREERRPFETGGVHRRTVRRGHLNSAKERRSSVLD